MRPEARAVGSRLIAPLTLTAFLAGCASLPPDGAPPPSEVPNISNIPNAVPRRLPRSPYGNPSRYEVNGHVYHVLKSAAGYQARGIASWYGTRFHGHLTSSGAPYDMFAMTAAHRTLPIPSFVRVTDLANGRSVVVKINDRGPFVDNRLIDLSYAAAAKLHMLKRGTAPVEVRAITPGHPLAAGSVLVASPGGGNRRPHATPGAAHGHAYVQVGAFSDRRNAERLKRRLTHARLAAPVSIQKVERSSGTLFRVHLGPIASATQLRNLDQALAALGIHHTELVGELAEGGDR